jgi:hypothetical protein
LKWGEKGSTSLLLPTLPNPESGVCGVTDDYRLPEPKTVFLSTGEEAYDFAGSDFGNEPEWTKEELVGRGIIIRGLSEDLFEPEGSSFPPARSVLYNLLEEDPNPSEPWGMFFSDKGDNDKATSVVIQQVRKQIRRGRLPFVATLTKHESTTFKGQSYYSLEKYVPNATPVLQKMEVKKTPKA